MVFITNSWKNIAKVTLICLMFASLFLRSELVNVKAQPYFSIEATITTDDYWGYYGGYYEMWVKIQAELAKIGITLTIDRHDDYSWWDQVWEDGWNYTGDTNYDPQNNETGGWDVTMLEWWLQPHAVEPWFASMVLNNMTPIEEGFNIHPWMNPTATKLCWIGMYSFDADTRKAYLWEWQKEWMHDPPIAEIYYPRMFEMMGSYVVGYDSTGCWWYNIKHMDLNETEFDLVVDNTDRIATGKDTLIYAVSEEIWNWNPMFMDTYTEESVGVLVYDTLYTWSLNYTHDEWQQLASRVEPSFEDYIITPELASDEPTVLEGGKRMRVPLRDNVTWSDGEPFNATDVKYTYDMTFTPKAKCSGVGDFSYAIESVELVPDPGGVTDPYTGQGPIDPYKIDFVLREPHPDFKSIIANDWGGGTIMPWHSLKHLAPQHIKGDASNSDWTQMLPGTGPFRVTDYLADSYITLERNDLHWGYAMGYGPYVNRLILRVVDDPETRKSQLQTNAIDFGEYPLAEVSEYYDMMTWDNVRVFQYNYPASNGVWFNFNNRILSNRYVRQAIAHAIPYDNLYSTTLQTWGVESVVRGITHILPINYYTDPDGKTVPLFNDELAPYEYDLTKAQQYLNMYLYSENGTDYTLGPVGDGDFSGRVDFDDFFVWWENGGLGPDEWPWIPGMDVDPDYNNDGYVTHPEDFNLWRTNYGKAYPFEGAR